MPKGVYERTADNKPKQRTYPFEIVSQAVALYESGCTVSEVQAALPKGYKAQRIIERYVPERRPAIKRTNRARPTLHGDGKTPAIAPSTCAWARHQRIRAWTATPPPLTGLTKADAPER